MSFYESNILELASDCMNFRNILEPAWENEIFNKWLYNWVNLHFALQKFVFLVILYGDPCLKLKGLYNLVHSNIITNRLLLAWYR